MGGGKTNGIGRYDVPRVYLTRQTFEGDEAKLQKLREELDFVEGELQSHLPLEKIYADLLAASSPDSPSKTAGSTISSGSPSGPAFGRWRGSTSKKTD